MTLPATDQAEGSCRHCPTCRSAGYPAPGTLILSTSLISLEVAAACPLLSAGSRLRWTTTRQKPVRLRFHSKLLLYCKCVASQFPFSSWLRVPSLGPDRSLPVRGSARLQKAEPGALAGHGLRGSTGRRRAGRPRGAKAIVLDWRILTQMAREKQIGREMNKLYR